MLALANLLAMSMLLVLFCHPYLLADQVAVRYPQGTTHGFLVLRTENGRPIALGDLTQVVRGSQIQARLRFSFRDGSVDDDQVVYSQDHVFHLLRDHHVQRGPTFPKPLDMSLDTRSGIVTSRDKDKVKSKHMDLPPDLANGLTMVLLSNIRPDAPKTVLPMLVQFQGPRIIHLEVTPSGNLPVKTGGRLLQGQQFTVKVNLGGLTGAIAPIVGKQPHDLSFVLLEGSAPAFVHEEGQFFEDGPVWRIDQVVPVLVTSR